MAQVKQMPVNPAMVRWAREEAGLTVEELADTVGVTAVVAAGWESGKAEPNKGQFLKLARAVGRTPSVLFLAEPPAKSSVAPRFRAKTREQANRPLSTRERDALRTAQRLARITGWVVREGGGKPVELPYYKDFNTIDEVAKATATVLSWSVQEQRSARDPREAFNRLRVSIEEHGILVLQLNLERLSEGFALWDEWAPAICINAEQIPKKRLYTLAHELGHLVRRDTALTLDQHDADERWCEEFAAAFLMPRESVRHLFAVNPALGKLDEMALVNHVSGHFRVSLRSAALRLIELGFAERALYGRIDRAAEWTPKKSTPGGLGKQGRRPQRRLREYGRAFANSLTDAEARGLLTRHDVRQYLGVSDSDLTEVRELIRGSGA
jgi:Zn-dependent peptidase ImmA (M78 family)/DNA-binding XRE family transcriptional regulator